MVDAGGDLRDQTAAYELGDGGSADLTRNEDFRPRRCRCTAAIETRFAISVARQVANSRAGGLRG
jgi:hypothetical protein